MKKPIKGTLLNEGKTKRIWSVEGDPDGVIIENKDDITKNDDASQTKVMAGKAELATSTTCAVFQLLRDAGIPVAFEGQVGPNEFSARRVTMLPLEIIWRRYAVGSFLKRHPELHVAEGELPHRFHSAVFELFLKTTGGIAIGRDGKECVRMPEKDGKPVVEDPFIKEPYASVWNLAHPKKPEYLHISVAQSKVLPGDVSVSDIEELLRRVGLVLEGAWAQLGCRLIDFKIEMGVTPEGVLTVADVIDADSWRLRDANWNEMSKQLFRDGIDMDQIADKYAMVARLVERLRIPKQAIVLWRGSDSDKFPTISSVPGVEAVSVTLSGHKSPQACLTKLEEILTLFPEGAVILACIGMSNGLGPILSARTSWPVIGVAMTADQHPEDVWSSLRMPSNVPMVTVLSPKNAMLAALNILAQKNPAAYAYRQLAIEKLDA